VDNVIDWNVLAPRIGAIFDPAGNARTLLKFNYGQYWFGPGTNLGPNANPNSPDWWQRDSWSDLNKDGVWERGEEGGIIESRGSLELESLDPSCTCQSWKRSPCRWSASCLRTSAFEQVSCGEASDGTTCGRTRTAPLGRSLSP
jgi:hypothetical protein